ncbi:unnamed protein product, partial [Effrenium voratum]
LWRTHLLPEDEQVHFGRCVHLRGKDSEQVVHCALLRCRCPGLSKRKLPAHGRLDLPGVSASALADLRAYLYAGALPGGEELPRLQALRSAAQAADLPVLLRICGAMGAEAVEARAMPEVRIPASGAVGSQLTGAVLEADFAELLKELELDDSLDRGDRVYLVFGDKMRPCSGLGFRSAASG